MDDAALISSLASQGPLLLTAIHVATAGTVTIHALMRKRDVPAAIGWIGLAWLAPVFGSLLYITFGINRVERRARRLKRRPSQAIDDTPQPSAHVPEP